MQETAAVSRRSDVEPPRRALLRSHAVLMRAAIVLLLPVLVLASCGGCAASSGEAPTGGPSQPLIPAWSYDITLGPDARELEIQAEYAASSARALSVQSGAEPFVHGLEIADGDHWRVLEASDDFWNLPDDGRAHRLRYHFLLYDAAHALRDPDTASYSHDVLVAPPSTWLLHPFDSEARARFRLTIHVPAGVSYVCGVTPDPSGTPDTFAGAAEDLSMTPYCAFGPLKLHRLKAGGDAEIDLALAPDGYAVSEAEIVAWVERSARAVSAYYGIFPMRHSAVIVTEGRGRSVSGGKTMGNSGATILISIGTRAKERALDEDWILTHEMIHLALPSVARPHHWLEEGSATYIEPIARVRAGQHTPEQAWRELIEGLPQGLPRPGDKGLDHTPTWGRTYWGGALYWLLADIDIRKRTDNRKGLEDALRGVIDAGGTIAETWDIERVLEAGDRAVGVPALTELYHEMANDPHPVDLPALWNELGISVEGRRVTFDDHAPLARIRVAITRKQN
jgi:hypothetical protein